MKLENINKNINLRNLDCDYSDIRVESKEETSIRFRDNELEACDLKPTMGAFLRILRNGQWYYAATTDVQNLQDVLLALNERARAIDIRGDVKPPPKSQDPGPHNLIKYRERNATKIPLEKKVGLCRDFLPILKKYPLIKKNMVSYRDMYKTKYFLSSQGTEYCYDYNEHGVRIGYTLKEEKDDGRIFNDSYSEYSDSFEGLSAVKDLLSREIEESQLFLAAETVKPGQYKVVLDSLGVGVFAHESFGHKSEADFMIGDDGAKKAWTIGARVGSEVLSIVDDGSLGGTSGYCPFDDEGNRKEKTYLIKNGILSGRLHSSHTAQVFDERPTGNGRAINFEFEPIVRMTSTFIEPGDISFQEMLAKMGEGIYIKTVTHGSGLSTFTIAPKRAYLVKNGQIADPIRASVISGSVFETLNNIEACSREFKVWSSVFGGCGKMEQSPLPVGLGGPKILVSKMMVS